MLALKVTAPFFEADSMSINICIIIILNECTISEQQVRTKTLRPGLPKMLFNDYIITYSICYISNLEEIVYLYSVFDITCITSSAQIVPHLLEIKINYHIIQEFPLIQTEKVFISYGDPTCLGRRRPDKQPEKHDIRNTDSNYRDISQHKVISQ